MDAKEIYQKLNQLHTPYEEIGLSKEEEKSLRDLSKTFALKKKRQEKKIYRQIAAILVLSLAIGSVFLREDARAKVQSIASTVQVTLAQAFGLSTTSNQYNVALHEPIVIEDREYILENLSIDGKDLWISILQDAKGDMWEEKAPNLSHIKVNGEKIQVLSSGGSMGQLDEHKEVIVSNLLCQLGKPVEITQNSKLELFFTFYETNKKANLVLNITPEQVHKETKTLVENFPIPKSHGIEIQSFKINPVSQKIVLSLPKLKDSMPTGLIGRDNLGRKIVFETLYSNEKEAALFLSPLQSEVTSEQLLNEVESITFHLEGTHFPKDSGRSNPSTQWGEEFTLICK